ncbi:MAG TPA: hypothetical protein VGJ12_11375 [Gemmatimonadaceae bacterium]|jgi:hypothetical protein
MRHAIVHNGTVAGFEDLYGNRWDLVEHGAQSQAALDVPQVSSAP